MTQLIGDEKLDKEDFSLAMESQLDRFSDVYRSRNRCKEKVPQYGRLCR